MIYVMLFVWNKSKITHIFCTMFAGGREQLNLQLTCKWGFDGATTQSTYKHGGTSSAEADSQVLFTSMVPLQLAEINSDTSRVIWNNRTPSSGRFARPLKLENAKETAERSKAELEQTN